MKKLLTKWWFWLIIIVLVVGGGRSINKDNNLPNNDKVPEATEVITDAPVVTSAPTEEPTAQPTEAPTEEPIIEVTTAPEEAPTSTNEPEEQSADGITLDGTTISEYGKEMVLNEGSEFELKFIGYFLPSGTYTVTIIGDNKSVQITPYYDRIQVVDNWQEFETPDERPIVLFAGESKELKIEEGVFIKLSDPCTCLFTKTSK